MRIPYETVDVFTREPFAGNPLAVITDAGGMSPEQMQQVAREFNYSETTFVLPPTDASNTRHVRIFTPTRELPFAGHPNVGTAHVLAVAGLLGKPIEGRIRACFEEAAGLVQVEIQLDDPRAPRCEITAPARLQCRPGPDVELLARAIGLNREEILLEPIPPTCASAGLEFLIAELRSLDALARVRVDPQSYLALASGGVPTGVHLFTRDVGHLALDVRARMFAPLGGVLEDPATGSANCALAGLLALHDGGGSASRSYRIGQGFEMGRPSELELCVQMSNGGVERILLAGRCASVMCGELVLP